MKKIGVLGGTFDPVHNAHMVLAATAMDAAGLDEVWLMPAKNPPHKTGLDITEDHHRLNMLKTASKGRERITVSDFEFKRPGPSYSSDTFRMLKESYPDCEFYLIIGGDSLVSLDKWHEPEVLFKHAKILATSRCSIDRSLILEKTAHFIDDMGADIQLFDTPAMEISSSDIRDRIRFGFSAEGMVDKEVLKYIEAEELYVEERFCRIRKELEAELKPERFAHTMNVARTAYDLAKTWGCDVYKAYLAGLLHDCGKALKYKDQIAAAEQFGIELSEVERSKPGALVHAKLGAYLARMKFGVDDDDILNAISFHTTGRPGMSMLERIIFLADYIEPGRAIPSIPPLAKIRLIALTDIDRAVYLELSNMVRYLKELGEEIDGRTIETLEYYKQQTEK